MAGRIPLLVALAILGFGLVACQPKTAQRGPCPAGQRCLEFGNSVDPTTLDPQKATAVNEATIIRELFDGMFTDGPNGAPVPGVAERWETSPDGLVWTFHMRREFWSDGEPVTARDFVFAYQRMLDPKSASEYAYLLYVLKNAAAVNAGNAPLEAVGARAIDDHTLQLTLDHPAPYLPQLLKHQAFYPIPEHVVRRWGDAWVDPSHLVGNGAYVLTQSRLGDLIRVVRNRRFVGADKVCFDQVTFYPTNDAITAERRVLRGELDVNAAIATNRVPHLRSLPQSANFVRTSPYLSSYYLIFNQHDPGPLKDVRVRLALSMAIDRDFIVDRVLRAGRASTSFVPPNVAGYVPAAERPHPVWAEWPLLRRQAAARQLLADAGYAGKRPKFQLKTSNLQSALIQAVQADFRDIGVDLNLRQEDGIIMFQSYRTRDFQLGFAGWIADFNDPLTFLGLMKSDTGAQNYGDYRSAAYDALLDQADHEPDGAKRARLLARAEQMMLNVANIAPIYQSVSTNLVSPQITGWVDNESDVHPIRYLCRNAAAPARPVPPP